MLSSLSLSGCQISDEGCQQISAALKRNVRPMLTAVSLAENGIRDPGSLQIGELLRTNSSLTKIDLRVNSIGDEGVKSLADALSVNHTLTILSLSHNDISLGASGVGFLSKVVKGVNKATNMTIDILDAPEASLEVAVTKSEILGGHTVFVTDVMLFTDRWTTKKRYSQFEKLFSSILLENPLDVHDVLFPPKALGLGDPAGFFASIIGDAQLLESRRSGLDTFVKHLCHRSRCNCLSHSTIKKMRHFLDVDELDMVTRLQNAKERVQGVAEANSLIKDLILPNCGLGCSATLGVLAEAMKKNTVLRVLDLCGNQLGVAGAAVMADAIRSNSTLTRLDISDNKLGSEGMLLLADSLRTRISQRQQQGGGGGGGDDSSTSLTLNSRRSCSLLASLAYSCCNCSRMSLGQMARGYWRRLWIRMTLSHS